MILRFLTMIALVVTSSAGGTDEPFTLHRVQVCPPAPSGWCKAESTHGAFTVELPIPFNDVEMPFVSDDKHDAGTIHSVGGKNKQLGDYKALCVHYTAGGPNLDKVRKGYSNTSPVSHRGMNGFRGNITNLGSKAEYLFLANDHIQCMLMVEMRGVFRSLPADRERFFSSFDPSPSVQSAIHMELRRGQSD
jgi:hypothetical protein